MVPWGQASRSSHTEVTFDNPLLFYHSPTPAPNPRFLTLLNVLTHSLSLSSLPYSHPSVLLPTKDLCGGDLVQEAGDSFAINMAQGHPHGFAKPSSGCTGISSASTKPPLLLFLGVTLVPSSADSPSWLQLTPYFHSHTHLPVKSLDVQAFLGRAHHKVFYGKKEFRRKQKQS